ncbi:hypothetical protein ULF88_01820 [Halopseudomonas pachastrellae]|nr:hypothetical protein [Halopseudomonas pachastrellae]
MEDHDHPLDATEQAITGARHTGRMLWMRDYWDRYIKDEQDLQQSIQELQNTPVAAGLCEQPKQWRWSSAYESG